MGKTFKDKNKNYRFRDVDYDDGFRSNKSNKQDAKRFRQDRSQKRSMKEDEPASDE